MMRSTHLLQSILFLSSAILMAKAFSMLVGTATECGPLTISWTGGQSPFEIYTFPVNDTPRFYSVPSSAYSGNQGSYTISQFPMRQGKQFVLTLSDATGFATGGTTDVITVAAPTSSSSCNTTFPLPSFYFSEQGSLAQCGSYEFNQYSGAILPVTFLGLIPGGESFVLQSGVTAASYTWTVDVQAGTSIIFSMWDAQNNTGGSWIVETVASSNDASCLSSNSPSSTANIPQSSQSGPSSPSTSQASPSSSTNLSTATIAGIAGGGVVALAALAFLGLCLIQRRRKNDSMHSPSEPRNMPPLHSENLHHDRDTSTTAHVYPLRHQREFVPSGQAIPRMTHVTPQVTYSLPRASTSLQRDPSASINTPNVAAYNNTDISSVPPSAPGKGSMIVMAPGSTRYIVHTDVEGAPPTASQVIELPPQYSESPEPRWQQSPSRPLSLGTEYGGTEFTYVSNTLDRNSLYPQPHSPL